MGGGKLKKTAMVQFAWRAAVGDFEAEHAVQVRCDHACSQGIPLPEPLKEACRRHRLEEAAKESVSAAQSVLGSGVALSCRRRLMHHVA